MNGGKVTWSSCINATQRTKRPVIEVRGGCGRAVQLGSAGPIGCPKSLVGIAQA